MVGYRNDRVLLRYNAISIAGIPMVGYRNAVRQADHQRVLV